MTIKKVIVLSSTMIVLAAVMLVFSLVLADRGVKATREAQQLKTLSLSLAEELKESSRGLTSAVQKFIITGDEQYANSYMDIILIRSGDKPRPEDKEIAPGETVSLNDLMRQAQFSEYELALLQQSSELSDKLTDLEIRAMNAMRGLFPDSEGQYTISGQPDKSQAIELIFNPEYENEVSMIMRPIVLFNAELNNRLNAAIISANNNYDRGIKIVWIVFIFVITLIVVSLLLVGLLIVRPILMFDTFAKQVTDGNFHNDLSYTSNNEIGSLAVSLRTMVKSLVERIHIEEHARYFDAVISMADAGVIVMDSNHLITDWNVGAENIFGFSAEEMKGKSRKYYAPKYSYSSIDNIEARLKSGERIARDDVERKHKNGQLVVCSASYTPIFDNYGTYKGSVAIFHDITDKKQTELALKQAMQEIGEKHEIIMSSISYASKIQKNLLPSNNTFGKAFSDHAIIWSPRDIVGGDIYWIKNFTEGSVLIVCDCTGHGTPGALLTMLVVSAFENIITEDNYKDTAQILWLLEQRLVTVLNVSRKSDDIKDGCDLAILYISKSGKINISSGNTSVFVCDGKEVRRIKGQMLFVGEGKIGGKDDIKTIEVQAKPNSKFYIASDGLFDQIGGNPPHLIGYRYFMNLMIRHHDSNLTDIADIFWKAFEEHRGNEIRRDDVELVAFRL